MRNWDAAYKQHGIVQKPVLDVVRKAAEIFQANKVETILDLGFGTGRHTIFLAEKGFDVSGIEISEEGLGITSKLLKDQNLKANLQIANSKQLPYEDNSFDAVVCTFVIGHDLKKDVEKSFAEMKRVLRENGFIVLALLSTKDGFFGQGKKLEENTYVGVPDVDHDLPHHFFTEEELKELLPNFKFIHLEERTGFCLNGRRQMNEGFFEVIAQKS